MRRRSGAAGAEQEVEGLLTEPHRDRTSRHSGRQISRFIMSRQVEDEAEILSSRSRIARRGRGLARNLLTLHLRRWRLGRRTVFLKSNENNKPGDPLYDRAGFREISRRPNYYASPGAKPPPRWCCAATSPKSPSARSICDMRAKTETVPHRGPRRTKKALKDAISRPYAPPRACA